MDLSIRGLIPVRKRFRVHRHFFETVRVRRGENSSAVAIIDKMAMKKSALKTGSFISTTM
jgi:hypothetical protein